MNTSRTSTSFLYPLLSWNFVLRLLFIGLFLLVSLANTFAIKVRNDNAWASVRIHYWNGGTGSDWGSRPTMTAATTPAWDTSGKSWVEWNINTCTDIKLTGTNEPPSTNDINGVSNDGCYTMSSDATPTLTRVDCATGGAYVPPVPVINFAVTGGVVSGTTEWNTSPPSSCIFEETGTNTYSLCFIYDSKAFKLLRKENGLPNTNWDWSSAVAIVAGSNVSGSSGDLTITGFTTGDPVCLQLVVSGTTYTLSAEQSVYITSDLPNPINQGADITLTANNVSSACTWEYSTDGGTTWQPYTGATSGTYNEEISPSPLTNMTYRVTSDGKTATYMVQVVINCQGSIQTHFTETFGTLPTATARTTSAHIHSSVYQYSPEGKEVHDGWYAVVANPRNCGRGTRQSTIVDGVVTVLGDVRTSGDYWYNDRTDHTGDTHGGMLFVNCKDKGEIIYQRTITDLCANIYMNFSAWFANAAVPSSTAPINTQFRILDQNGDEIQSARINVNNIKASDGWVHGSTAFFSGNNTQLTLQIINNGEAGVGNDILIDDISFTSCVPKLSIQAGLEVECGLVTELSVEHDGINTVFNGPPFYLW
ncbi:MAG TPA: hypothetical protein PLD76_06095, partial [Paludibacteraceae bacterium]|nr:hypothetical protein [Paludibacteraceae bacterium]